MRKNEFKLEANDIRVKVLTFDSNSMASDYIKETELTWPMLRDPERELYSSYGMTRGSWLSLYNPISIWKYIKVILAGTKPGKPGKDWAQLGGDVLIDPQGIVRMLHTSLNPHDRPQVQTILQTVVDSNS